MPYALYEDEERIRQCEHCGAELRGQTTKHAAGCPWLAIEEADARVRRMFEEDESPDAA